MNIAFIWPPVLKEEEPIVGDNDATNLVIKQEWNEALREVLIEYAEAWERLSEL